MGNDEGATPSKSDKASSPRKEQPANHPYPDWATMQAYYGAGVSMPPPYFNTIVAPGHAPHPYMWGPQASIAPFGMPYPAIYPHGVYPHPSVTVGAHSPCQGIALPPITTEAVMMASPLSTEAPVKSSSNRAKSLMKKLKAFDGLAVSLGNGNAENISGDVNALSQSGENGAELSSDGSDENNESGGNTAQRKRSSENMPTSGKPMVIMPASSLPPGIEFRASSPSQLKAGSTPAPAATTAMVPGRDGSHPEVWTQDERELKRERRKQSNRESARRSRLRKQAESEELAIKVESLSAENTSLKSEINQMKEKSEKLRAENSTLMGKLKNEEERSPDESKTQGAPHVLVENFLSRIDKLREDEARENSSGKLHQLLDSGPRTDAMAAG